MKTFRQLMEGFGADCAEQTSPITDKEAGTFAATWRQAMKKFFGVEFDFSTHFVRDSLNHSRNRPLISTCEVNFVLTRFLKKYQHQLKKDVQDVKDGVAKPRGKNRERLKPNELEFVISSATTNINFVFALKNDYGKKGTAVILPVTIMRKPKFKITKGVQVFVEGVEYDPENVYHVE